MEIKNSALEHLERGGPVSELSEEQLYALRNEILQSKKPDPRIERLDEETKNYIVQERMAAMGKKTSEAKTAAVRRNATQPRPNRKPRPLREIPCTCGQCPADGVMPPPDFKPDLKCKRGKAIYYRRYRNLDMNP